MPTAHVLTTTRVDPSTLVPGDLVLLSGWCYVTGETTRKNASEWVIPLVKETGDEGLVTVHQWAEKLTEGRPVSWQPEHLYPRIMQLRKRADVLAALAAKLDT